MSNISTDRLPCYGACHWGFNHPGGFLWARVFPNQRVYVQRVEQFHEMAVEDAAMRVHTINTELGVTRLRAIYAAPEMFTTTDEESDAMRVTPVSETFGRYGLGMVQASADTLNSWQRVHDYLRDAPDGKPWLVVSPECGRLTETLPLMMQKKGKPDEAESDAWAPRALRYLLSSRPAGATKPTRQTRFAPGTVGALKASDHRPTGLLARKRAW